MIVIEAAVHVGATVRVDWCTARQIVADEDLAGHTALPVAVQSPSLAKASDRLVLILDVRIMHRYDTHSESQSKAEEVKAMIVPMTVTAKCDPSDVEM